MKSTNEELDTSREELQSLNEELSTTNAELRDKNDLLVKANDDLRNFLDRTDIAIIFLDEELCIRSFTPASCALYKLKNIDIGRPLEDINSKLAYDGVISDAREVMRTLQHKKLEVQSKDQRWFTMRILPYRTVQNAISGLVLSFLDIDQQKRAVDELADVNVMLKKALEEQKKAEAEKARLLKESTESLDEIQTLLDNSPVAIWVARDLGCLTITGNIYANRLFGVRPGANISKSAEPSDAAVSYKVYCGGKELKPEELLAQMAVATGKPVLPYEIDLEFEDGRRLNMLIGAVPLLDASGRVRGSVSFGTDITERKKAEAALRESEEKFRAFAENTDIQIIMSTLPEGKVLYVNPSFEAKYLYGGGELVGSRTPDLYYDLDDRKQVVHELQTKGFINSFEMKGKRKDGTWFWNSLTARVIELGGQNVAITAALDITERKLAEAALKESEARFRSVLENSRDAIYRSNLQTGRFEYVSPAIESILGYTPAFR